MYKIFLNRCVDLIIARVSLIVTLPVLLIVLFLQAIANKGKVFFMQQRLGLHGKVFYIVKFKTMHDKIDAEGNLLADDIRLTAVGQWVRKLSLDEVPHLLNVIKGDRSLVGPRPLLVEYLPFYDTEQRRRHTVRLGITG
jgi:undecaprenyl phosphate N,N'-diacetylbacillosamine 1-phosphate transferase